MATWYIKNDIPYLEEFPELIDINDYPNNAWKIKDDIPYKVSFPNLIKINDAPNSAWTIKDGDLTPSKKCFPQMFKFTDAPLVMWRIDNYKEEDYYHIPWKLVFPPMPKLEKLHPDEIQYIDLGDVVIEDYDEDIIINDNGLTIGGAYEIDVIIPHLEYSNKNGGLITCEKNVVIYDEKVLALEIEIDLKGITQSLDDYADQYNSILNGNVDYHNRDFIVTGKQMRERGWNNFPKDECTYDYYQQFSFSIDGDDDRLYMIDITPISEDGYIYTPDLLKFYKDRFEGLDGDIASILASDSNKLIGNVYVGTLDDILEQKMEIGLQVNAINDDFLLLASKSHYETQSQLTKEKIEIYKSTDATHLPIDLEVDIIM